MSQQLFPKAFFWRRMHSFAGLWLTLFLIEHLLTNSQSALLIGNDGRGFVKAVNGIYSLPYLPVIEIVLLGVPILIHMLWGIQYLRTGLANSFSTDGSRPSLTQYPRNHTYTWQRITSWILVLGIVGHVVHMRFMEYPSKSQYGPERYYMVRLNFDKGLYTLSKRLNFQFYNRGEIEEFKAGVALPQPLIEAEGNIDSEGEELLLKQKLEQQQTWIAALERKTLSAGQVVAVANNFGTAELLMVRDTFKIPWLMALYTVLVLSACFHGFNGLWTFMISWGVTLTERSQKLMMRVVVSLMLLVAFLGLASIFGTYWINLKQ